MTASWFRFDNDRLILTLHVQPGAKRTEVVGLHGDALKIKVAAAAVEGQANARLLEFLKKAFDVASSQVLLKQGESARRKVVEITRPGRAPETLLPQAGNP